jgi:hypothetical protein
MTTNNGSHYVLPVLITEQYVITNDRNQPSNSTFLLAILAEFFTAFLSASR